VAPRRLGRRYARYGIRESDAERLPEREPELAGTH
jgi:hypothetical protein